MRFIALVALTVLAVVQEGFSRAAYHRRGSSDVCATVNGSLKVTFLGQLVPVGLIHVCLCISGIPGFLNSDTVALTAVGLVGPGAVTAALEALINSSSDHATCEYPDNAEASCVAGSPCGFHCKNGFTPSPPVHPKDCVCAFPNKVCNGVCGPFKLCPSAGPKKRELEHERRVQCGAGQTACGVYGFQGLNSAWECVDTQSDLESCGGCMVPLGKTPAHGVDCTAIPGVMDVTCTHGACVVRRCQPGYIVSLDGQYCLRQDIQNGDVQTGLYALKQML